MAHNGNKSEYFCVLYCEHDVFQIKSINAETPPIIRTRFAFVKNGKDRAIEHLCGKGCTAPVFGSCSSAG